MKMVVQNLVFKMLPFRSILALLLLTNSVGTLTAQFYPGGVAPTSNGVFNDYYYWNFSGLVTDLSAFPPTGMVPTTAGTSNNFTVTGAEYSGHYFTGYMFIPSGGTFRFRVCSDDGSRLTINNGTSDFTVAHDSIHPYTCAPAPVTVLFPSAGYYPIWVEYFNDFNLGQLGVEWAPSVGPFNPIPDANLFLNPHPLAFWFRADMGLTGCGINPVAWQSQTIAHTATRLASPPTCAGTLNFEPVLSTVPGGMGVPNHPGINTAVRYAAKTFSMAVRTGANVTARQVLYEQGGGTNGFNVYIENGFVYACVYRDMATGLPTENITCVGGTAGAAVSPGSAYIITFEYNGSGNTTLMVNGAAAQSLPSGTAWVPAHTGAVGIGEINNTTVFAGPTIVASGAIFGGEIGDLISYNTVLSPLNRNKMETYLAVKYGITVQHDYLRSDGVTVWTHTANPYHKNVAALGRDNAVGASNLNKTASVCQTPGGIGTLVGFTGTPAANGAFLVWGINDNVAAPVFTGSLPGMDGAVVLNKTWSARETGDVDNQMLYLANTVVFPTAGVRALVVSTDPVFDASDYIVPLVWNGTQYTAHLGTALGGLGGGVSYFTVANLPAPGGITVNATNQQINLWLDAKRPGAALPNGSLMPSWTNKVAGFYTGLSVVAPTYRTNRINFNPAAEFSGTQYMQIAGGLFGNGTVVNDVDMFIVSRTRTAGTRTALHQQHNNDELVLRLPAAASPAGEGATLETNNDNKLKVSLANSEMSAFPTAPQLWSVHAHTTAANSPHTQRRSIYLNGAVKGNDNNTANFTTNATGTSPFYLGFEPGTPNNFFDGDIAEVIVHTGPMTLVQQQRINSYLAIKYGLTLTHNYVNTDGVVTWNTVANTGYNNAIAGIGRDAATGLDQPRSTSSSSGSVLTLEGTPGNMEFVVVGQNNLAFAPLNNTNSPAGTKRSARVWRARKTGYTGTVDLSFNVASVPSYANVSFNLLIKNSDANFSSGSISFSGGLTDSILTFTGINFADGDYFTLCQVENPPTLEIVNTQPGTPATWEACIGSVLIFQYANVNGLPARVRLSTSSGTVLVNPIGHTFALTGGLYSGEFQITVPAGAITGPAELLDALGNLLYVPSNKMLVIHNPPLYLIPTKNPICASDTVAVVGIPAGGTFSSALTGFVNGSNLIGPNAAFPADTNIISKIIPVTYTFTPRYTNNVACPNPISITQNLTVYDNRLDVFELQRVIIQSSSPTAAVRLDTLIEVLRPSLPPSVQLVFGGTYVTQNPANPLTYLFLYGASGIGSFPITVSYNNNGCVAQRGTNIDILPEVNIPGLPFFRCRQADTVRFFRSPNFLYSVTKDTFYKPGTNNTRIDYIRTTYNNQMNTPNVVTTTNPAHAASVSIGALFPVNNEFFVFNAGALPLADTVVTIRVNYKNTREVQTFLYDQFNNFIGTTTSTTVTTFYGEQSVAITNRPTVSIDPVMTGQFFWCANTPLFVLHSTPIWDPLFSSYRVRHLASGGVSPVQSDTVMNMGVLYNTYDPSQLNDQNFRLTYRIDKYGCVDSANYDFRIVRPDRPQIIGSQFPSNIYCLNQSSDLLAVNPPYTSGLGGVFSGPGMGVNNAGAAGPPNMFSPVQAGAGFKTITYTYTNQYGCVSDTSVVFQVRPAPNLVLATDDGQSSYCANITNVGLHLQSLNGSSAVSVTFSGAGIIPGPTDTIFNPNQVFGGNAGSTTITAQFTDGFGCTGSNSKIITINNVPTPSITGMAASYCKNNPTVVLSATPNYNTGLNGFGGAFSGAGAFLLDTLYYFNPALAPAGINTLTYNYTNTFGCTGSTQIQVRVDTVPNARILNLPDYLCANAPPIALTALPDVSSPYSVLPTFGGIGITNAVLGTFSPAAAGSGVRVVSYTFRDLNGCQGVGYDTIYIAPLPPINFTGLNAEYCTDYGLDTLTGILLDTSIVGHGYFSGAVVQNPLTGVINTNLDTTGLRSVSYVYQDSVYGCINQVTRNFFIHPLPNVSITGIAPAYCSNNGDVIFTGSPVGNSGHFHLPGTSNLPVGVTNFATSQVRFSPGVAAQSGTNHTIYYTFVDNKGCRATTAVPTLVFPPGTPPQIVGLANQYCATRDTVYLQGQPAGGTFSSLIVGPGNNYFVPANGGGGVFNIVYAVQDTFTYGAGNSLYCTNRDTAQTTIVPLPFPRFDLAANSNFCINDPSFQLTGILLAGGPLDQNSLTTPSQVFYGSGVVPVSTIVNDTINSNGPPWQIVSYAAYTYFFHPSQAGSGTHVLTYRTRNIYGCTDSTTIAVNIYSPPSPNGTQFAPGGYCELTDPIVLIANGGSFSLSNGQPLNTGVYDPDALGLPAPPRIDTIIFTNSNTACTRVDTITVPVQPNPSADFTAQGYTDFKFCFVPGDTVHLLPSATGNNLSIRFFGDGTRQGTYYFIPSLASVGNIPVTLEVADTLTGCDNRIVKNFSVYSQPQAGYASKGGCAGDSVWFVPNNADLGLLPLSEGKDTLTRVQWLFGDGSSLTVNAFASNAIDTVVKVYPSGTAFVGPTQLIVTNQGVCTDTATVRVVVVPTVSATTTNPYVQHFEADNGSWIPEMQGQMADTLWQWGTPSTGNINANSPSNPSGGSKLWMTALNGSYPTNINTWIYSPCFDLSQLERPMISLDYWVQAAMDADGAVVEYFDRSSNKWKPLGAVERGINWYNSDLIIAKPGAQDFTTEVLPDGTIRLITPVGWSGKNEAWKNARYMLDDFVAANGRLRLRISFAASAINAGGITAGTQGDGFAFDNVWIGPRTRNALLEYFSHEYHPNMGRGNYLVYQNLLGQSLYKDAVHVQYHGDFDGYNYGDQYAEDNYPDPRARKLFYGITKPAQALVNGETKGNLTDASVMFDQDNFRQWFEQEILESPAFGLEAQMFVSGNQISISGTLTALKSMPVNNYTVQLAVVQDHLLYEAPPVPYYPSPSPASLETRRLFGVMRKLVPDHSGISYQRTWLPGNQEPFSAAWNIVPADYTNWNPNDALIVAFVQNNSTKEVYQVVSSRVITQFFVTATDNPQVQESLNEIADMNLYPNPAVDYFNVRFSAPLQGDYRWRLVSVLGQELRRGTVPAGTELLTVEGLEPLTAGTYIFVLENDLLRTQRPVALKRP